MFSLVLLTGVVWPVASLAPAHAATAPTSKVVDPATYHEYPGSQDAAGYFSASTNPGRIWTDKSVFDTQVEDPSGNVAPLTPGTDELVVGLSALGSTRQVTRAENIPVDAAIVVDFSTSMTQCVGSSGTCTAGNGANSRAEAMVAATNSAIGIILAANPDNRIAVVQFSTGTGTLIDLGRPEPITTGQNPTYLRLCAQSSSLYVTRAASGCTTQRTQVTGSTNLQRGIYRGMDLLASQPSASVAARRMPSVLVMSDGEPTYSVGPLASPTWWTIGNGGSDGSNVGPSSPTATQYPGTGFMAALSASYLKNRIDRTYATSDALGTRTRVYTVGLGIDALSEQGRDLARVTLDPAGNYDSTTNRFAPAFRTAFTAYRASGGTGTVPSLLVNNNQYYTAIGHPGGTGAVAAADPTSLKYDDAFYSPITAADLEEAFRTIASAIVEAAPNYPVEVEGTSPTTSGYLTFTDPLGDFMQVTSMNRVVFCSVLEDPDDPTDVPDPTDCDAKTFVDPKVTTVSDTVTRYTFQGTYEANNASGPADLSSLVIEVTSNPSLAVGDVVTVRLPAALLPMRDTTVVEDSDGNPETVSIFASHPVHVYYTVAPKPGVIDALGNPSSLNGPTSSDGTALAQYIAAHTVDGKVRFYSDDYTVTTAGSTTTKAARTLAAFRPADKNDFYRFTSDSPLYTSDAVDRTYTQAQWDALADDTPVYYTVVQYLNTTTPPTKRDMVLATTKKALLDAQDETHTVAAVEGVMTAPAGLFDLSGRAENIDQVKCNSLVWQDNLPVCQDAGPGPSGDVPGNLTATAQGARTTAMDPADAQTVHIQLGNNGYLTYSVPGRLTISKTVAAAVGLHPVATTPFTFTVSLTAAGGGTLGGQYSYSVYALTDPSTPVRTGTVASGGTIRLTDGQYATVVGLPDGAGYTVAEGALPRGYTQTVPAAGAPASGTVAEDSAATAAFTNTYAPAAAPALATPSAAKTLTGRNWADGDAFEVTLCGQGLPLPAGAADGCASATPDSPTSQPDFGTIVYTAPGTYVYTLTETDDQALGISYSAAAYRWTVTVSDDGSGVLAASGALTRVTGDDGTPASGAAAQAAFTNTFDAAETSLVLPARKLVRDLSVAGDAAAQTRDPEQSHTFAYAAVAVLPADSVTAPLPAGCTSGTCEVDSTPGSSTVHSGLVTFDADDVDHDFYYRVREVPDPDRAYVTYDDAVSFYRVAVTSADDGSGNAVVQAVWAMCTTTSQAVADDGPWGGCDPASAAYTSQTTPSFLNTYDPDPGTVSLPVTKTLQGRAWGQGETFTFTLEPNDDATRQAVADGTVVLPASRQITVARPATGDSASAAFEDLSFARQGNYQFAITEVRPDPALPGMVHDAHTLVYDVVVADATVDGLLEVEATPRGGQEQTVFTNRYLSTTVFAGVELRKTLAGRDQKAGEFTFTLVPADAASAARAGIAADGAELTTPDGGGPDQAVAVPLLEDLTFTQEDIDRTFTYTVTETSGGAGGVDYDTAERTVRLQPRYDATTGNLYVVTTVQGGPGGEVTVDSREGTVPEVPIANTYQADPGTAEVALTKTVTGRAWSEGETFSFTLAAITDGAPMPARAQVSVTGPADAGQEVPVDFGSITFTAPGVYEYSVQEDVPGDRAPGMTYDPSPALVTVTVTDDGSGTLHTEVAHDGNQGFVNYYTTEYDFGWDVAKTLTGRDLAAGEFTFSVVPTDAASATFAHLPEAGTTFTNPAAADGAAALMPRLTDVLVTQDDAGHTYCYTYSEQSGSLPGLTYDTTAYTACLAVADDGLGAITVHTTVTGSDGSTAEFTNASDDDPARDRPRVSFANLYEAPPTPPVTPTTPVPTTPVPTTPNPTTSATPTEPNPTSSVTANPSPSVTASGPMPSASTPAPTSDADPSEPAPDATTPSEGTGGDTTTDPTPDLTSGDTGEPGEPGLLPGEAGTTPSATATPPTGGLSFTGVEVGGAVFLALLLVAGGTILFALRRTRRAGA